MGPLVALLLALIGTGEARGANPPADLLADRAAAERVYYSHRTGTKLSFDEALPVDQLRRLVETDLAKEAALKKVYGIEVTPAMLAAEVQRINTTTRAPEILAELKAALGNDTNRFARTVTKPIVVERLLRSKFENDDALHAPQRREAEKVREQLLAARSSRPEEAPDAKFEIRNPKSETDSKTEIRRDETSAVSNLVAVLKAGHSNEVAEMTWQLRARPAGAGASSADEMEIKRQFGPNAQLLSRPGDASAERKSYFEDLPADLQRVLRAQLRRAGDVSAVIETPGGFLLYLARDKTATTLSMAVLSIPKKSLGQWLSEQTGSTP